MPSRILLQLDSDAHPSAFDSVVAIDAGVDHLLRYGSVQAENLTPLVHGAMFTRGGDTLRQTALFIGGSDVSEAETLFRAAQDAFFGPVRVSIMLDASGCNTTAAAAVVAAGRHADYRGTRAVVFGGTGPVGQRVAQLLAAEGAHVTLTSRSKERASAVCERIAGKVSGAQLESQTLSDPDQSQAILDGAGIVISCGAAGVQMVPEETIRDIDSLQVAIDLNAVPPAGIGGVEVTARAEPLGSGVGYGAIGVGGLKMKTHKAALASLFESNDRVLDAEEIHAIAKSIG